MTLDGPGQRPDTHNVALDLDGLGDGARLSLTDDEPGSFDDQARVSDLVDEGPGEPRIVLAIQVDNEIDPVKVGLCHGSVASLVERVAHDLMLARQEPGDQ
jgi:hypothetical protein